MLKRLIVGAAWLFAAGCALAQADFPSKPVRWIAPFAPGGFSDILARYLGPQLTEEWRQSVIVDNRPGAGGTIAAEIVLRAPADGYTILAGTISSHAINVAIRPDLPFNPVRDFAPVTMLAKQPSLLVAHPSLPVRNFSELVSLARRQPGNLAYGTPGIGTSMHMSAELMRQMASVDITHVPYKGGGPALTDVVSGHVPLAVIGFAVAAPLVKQGRLRGIAVTSASRSPVLPDVPALAEQGLKNFEVTSWHALFVKAGTSPEVIERLHRSMVRVLNRPDNRKHFQAEGAELVSSTPGELQAFLEAEIARWTKVARTAGIKAN